MEGTGFKMLAKNNTLRLDYGNCSVKLIYAGNSYIIPNFANRWQGSSKSGTGLSS